MRVNVIDGATKDFIVVTMFPDEAEKLLGIAGFLRGGYDDSKVDAMQQFETLLQSGMEEIASKVRTNQN